ncbi:lipocalin family protein [Pontimicrobium sp. SW4]|uniref:Lipocalin family protein n=1 Tax=Pontimicrobium sp. SW4 TaxID=3153519 RepID=A0AAU7BVG9_9FLAO
MNFRSLLYIVIIAFTFSNCTSNPEDEIAFIEGYWEIKEVKKDNKLIKAYNANLSVDYFEINNDLTGFRKKVTPTLNGTFIVNQDEAPFTLKIENDSLNIYYNHNSIITKETIIRATKEELVIVNSQGFRYIYNPYKSINIDE